jgi:predicted DNA-binding transcriptional regulator AlpA
MSENFMPKNTSHFDGPEPEQLLLNVKDVARVLGFSVRQIRRWDYDRRLPAPIKFNRRKRWRKSDIEAWVAAGCPDLSWQRHNECEQSAD